MESDSEREFVAPHGRKWPWTSFVGKKRESYDKQKAALRHRRLRNAYRFSEWALSPGVARARSPLTTECG